MDAAVREEARSISSVARDDGIARCCVQTLVKRVAVEGDAALPAP